MTIPVPILVGVGLLAIVGLWDLAANGYQVARDLPYQVAARRRKLEASRRWRDQSAAAGDPRDG